MLEEALKKEGIVFNIQKFSVHDGPGIRTIVFVKGCPLACKWCSNPESQQPFSLVMLNGNNCMKCGVCQQVCTVQAIDYSLPGYINRQLCVNCGKCAEACLAKALVISGHTMSVEEVMQELKKDAIQYRRSNGGITVSGGEPLVQADFVAALLKASKNQGWHTAIETTGHGTKESLEKIIPYTDLVLLDIKQIDPVRHQQGTGIDNRLILENALQISKMAKEVIVRVPIIPGFNEDPGSIRMIAEFAKYLDRVKEIHLLPYHRLGSNKYEALGRKMLSGEVLMTSASMAQLKRLVEEQGFYCVLGGE